MEWDSFHFEVSPKLILAKIMEWDSFYKMETNGSRQRKTFFKHYCLQSQKLHLLS